MAQNSDVVFSIVGFPADVRAVFEEVQQARSSIALMPQCVTKT